MNSGSYQSFQSNCEEDTIALAGKVAAALRGGEYLSLKGDLGAGKTFFARALIHALGVEGNITSPTYVLQKIYPAGPRNPGIREIVHYDFYRIANYSELLDLGFEDHDDTQIVLAEWGDRFLENFPVSPVKLGFISQSETSRLITLSGLNLSA